MITVKHADDMYTLKIGEIFTYKNRQYLFSEYSGTIAKNYETFFVCPVNRGGRVQIKLPANN